MLTLYIVSSINSGTTIMSWHLTTKVVSTRFALQLLVASFAMLIRKTLFFSVVCLLRMAESSTQRQQKEAAPNWVALWTRDRALLTDYHDVRHVQGTCLNAQVTLAILSWPSLFSMLDSLQRLSKYFDVCVSFAQSSWSIQ